MAAAKAEEERSVAAEGVGIEQEQGMPEKPKPRRGRRRRRRPLQPIEKEDIIPSPNQPQPAPMKMMIWKKLVPTKQGQGDCFQSENKENKHAAMPISNSSNYVPGNNVVGCDEESSEGRSLGEELSAARKKVERLRMEREKTEEKLNERERWLDGQMKAIVERGEVQKLLELQVDRLYRLNQLLHLRSSCRCPHSISTPLRSLRDNHNQPNNGHDHDHDHDVLSSPSSSSSSSSSSTTALGPIPLLSFDFIPTPCHDHVPAALPSSLNTQVQI